MNKKSLKKNYIYNLLYEVLTILVPLITTPYISRVIGSEGIGIYSFTYSIAAYFAFVAALGSTTYARREIAYQQDNMEKRSVIFWEVFLFRIIMTFLSVLLYAIIIFTSKYHLISIIQMIYIISVIFDVTWFFQGMEEFGKITLVNTIIKILNIISIFVFVKTVNDLNEYIFILAITPLIGNVFSWIFLIKQIKKVKLNNIHPMKHFKGSLALFIPTIAAQVYLLLDKTMLGLFTPNNTENGYYEQAQKVIKICWTFLTTLAAVMAPRIAYLLSNRKLKEIKDYLIKSFKIMWLISCPIAFGICAISYNMVPWFFGDEFLKVSILLILFSFILFPIGVNSITGNQYLIIFNKTKPYTISIFLGALINLIFNFALIPNFYSVGAAIGSVVAEIVIAIFQMVYIIKHDKFMSLRDMFRESWKVFLASIFMFISIIYFALNFAATFISTFILIAVGGIIYLGVLLILKDSTVYQFIDKLFLIVRRKKES